MLKWFVYWVSFIKSPKQECGKEKLNFIHTHTNRKGKMLTRGTNCEQKTERPLVKS